MILPVQLARAAAQGRITLALIPIGKPRTVTRRTKNKNRVRYTSQPWKPKPGHREPLLARVGGKNAGTGRHIIITNTRETDLRWLLEPTDDTLKLVRAAGFKTRAELANHWMTQHDRDWPPLEEALCDQCEGFGEKDGEPCDNPECDLGVVFIPATIPDEGVLLRFEAFADTRVHLVHFGVDGSEATEYLSPAGRPRGDDLGHTQTYDGIDAGGLVDRRSQTGFVEDARKNRRKAINIESENERKELARLLDELQRRSPDVRVARELKHIRARLKRIDAILTDRAA